MTIAIIGFSRFGQLWASLLKPFGNVIVFNRTDRSQQAKEIGVEFYSLDNLDKIKQADMIFIAVAIDKTEEVIKKISSLVKPGSIMMDVCSVKVKPCEWLKNNLPDNIQVLGTHPMFGPDSSKTGLTGKQIVLCPINISSDNLKKIKKIFKDLKLTIIETSPEDHDQQTAYSLAMVHFLGRGLEKLNLEKIQITTLGFDRLLSLQENVSNDSWELFKNMHKFNPYSKKVRQELLDSLSEIEKLCQPHNRR